MDEKNAWQVLCIQEEYRLYKKISFFGVANTERFKYIQSHSMKYMRWTRYMMEVAKLKQVGHV